LNVENQALFTKAAPPGAAFICRLHIEGEMPNEIPQKEIDEAIAELDKVRAEWMSRPGVTALDVGYQFIGGKMTDRLAIRVHVRRKLPREALPAYEVFPEYLGRFPVDIIEAEYGLESL
jgi:hypothetical protein